MIEVQIKGEQIPFWYVGGKHAVSDENGWISILDDDGLVLGMHHKDHVIGVLIKAGENDARRNIEPDGSTAK